MQDHNWENGVWNRECCFPWEIHLRTLLVHVMPVRLGICEVIAGESASSLGVWGGSGVT
jgi:hypothetical protein